MSRITDFIAYLESKLGNVYVWGAQGQVLSTMKDPIKWIISMETKKGQKQVERAIAFYKKVLAAGKSPIEAYDCSGLIMFYVQNLKGWSKGDSSADGLYKASKKITKTQLQPGDFVFIINPATGVMRHVGVYIGGGQTIEAYGRDLGVVKRPLSAGEWTHFGRHPVLQVVDAPASTPTKPSVPAMPTTAPKPFYAVCGGQGVNIRTGRGTANASLGKADKEALMLAQPAVENWHAVAVVINGKLVTGYMHGDYVKEVTRV